MKLFLSLSVCYDINTIKKGDAEEMEIHLKNRISSMIEDGSIDLAPNTNAGIEEYSLEVTTGI